MKADGNYRHFSHPLMKTKNLNITQLHLFTIIFLVPMLVNFIKPSDDMKNDKKKMRDMEPADKMAKQEVKKVYNWACNINRSEDNRIISGQYSYASCEAIAKQTAKPAIAVHMTIL